MKRCSIGWINLHLVRRLGIGKGEISLPFCLCRNRRDLFSEPPCFVRQFDYGLGVACGSLRAVGS